MIKPKKDDNKIVKLSKVYKNSLKNQEKLKRYIKDERSNRSIYPTN